MRDQKLGKGRGWNKLIVRAMSLEHVWEGNLYFLTWGRYWGRVLTAEFILSRLSFYGQLDLLEQLECRLTVPPYDVFLQCYSLLLL